MRISDEEFKSGGHH